MPMSFESILFDKSIDRTKAENADAPSYFVDLNLSQIVDAVTENWKEYNLKPFFYFPLGRVETIEYRHEIFLDLENQKLLACIHTFAAGMGEVHEFLEQVEKLHYKYQQEDWLLYAIGVYCQTIKAFVHDLSSMPIKSGGLLAFREYLADYAASAGFVSLAAEAEKIKADLGKVRYNLLIKNDTIAVRNYEEETDYSTEIEQTFAKFKLEGAKNYKVKYSSSPERMDHVEAVILDFVAKLNPDVFGQLDDYCMRHQNFIDETVAVFDREVHFYVAYLAHIEKFKNEKLAFCYPRVGASKEIHDCEGFDLALAEKLTKNGAPIVCNDFFLKDKERIIVVTGPNQGGKTTFARTFGQLHYLASIGCPVAGREAQLFLFDRLFTQFERAEKVENLRGKLEDDLSRIRSVLGEATPRSIIILNEIFNSTTLQDVVFLSNKVMDKIVQLDLLCVWVTFVDELASSGTTVVSMASTITPENPTLRTFKIVRRPADGLAYAMAIVEKYLLTYEHIKERIAP